MADEVASRAIALKSYTRTSALGSDLIYVERTRSETETNHAKQEFVFESKSW
jgi:hypothetical protein